MIQVHFWFMTRRISNSDWFESTFFRLHALHGSNHEFLYQTILQKVWPKSIILDSSLQMPLLFKHNSWNGIAPIANVHLWYHWKRVHGIKVSKCCQEFLLILWWSTSKYYHHVYQSLFTEFGLYYKKVKIQNLKIFFTNLNTCEELHRTISLYALKVCIITENKLSGINKHRKISSSFFSYSLARRDMDQTIEKLDDKITHRAIKFADLEPIADDLCNDPIALELFSETEQPNI